MKKAIYGVLVTFFIAGACYGSAHPTPKISVQAYIMVVHRSIVLDLPSGATADTLLAAAAEKADQLLGHLDFSSAAVLQNGRKLGHDDIVSEGRVELINVKRTTPSDDEVSIPITVVIIHTTKTQETIQVKKWQSVTEINNELNERYGTKGQITGAYGKIVDGSLSDGTIKELQTGAQRYIYTANK